MKRKIVRQGQTTMTISLPSTWIKRYSLHAGDELDIEENGDAIIISTQKKALKENVQINTEHLYPLINRTITQLYIQGHKEIQLRVAEDIDVSAVVDELIGMEVVEKSSKKIIIKDLTGSFAEKTTVLVRRLFLYIKDLLDDAKNIFEAENNEDRHYQRLILRDKDMNKFVNLCLRQLFSEEEKHTQLTVAHIIRLEEIADHIKDLCRFCLKQKIKIDKDLQSLFSQIQTVYEKSYTFIYSKEKKDAVAAAQTFETARKTIKTQMLTNKKVEQSAVITHLYTLLMSIIPLLNYSLHTLAKE